LLKERSYERRLFRRFRLCTVAAPYEVEWVQALAGASVPVAVVPNGVDCDHNRLGLAQPKPNALIYSGSLTYRVNFDAMQWFLAEIYPRLRSAVSGVSLAITGSTRGVDTTRLALDPSVTLTGRVDDIRFPVAQADVCVVPIRGGGGTRLKILEAMALGTPVVATHKAAEGLDVVDGENIILADDPDAFAQCTAELLADPARRARLASAARRLVETRYDWGPIGRRFTELVEEAVAHRGRMEP
jgi:glycosyltransferase involved in cell wall biosynthesis